jgi:hypothetical protein
MIAVIDREWTFVQKYFTEREFREAFNRILPTDILHDAALAFLHTNRINVINFSVPVTVPVTSQHTNLKRNVVFIQRPGSNYFTMFSFMWNQRNDNVEEHRRAFAENARTGNMPEYAILGMIEPMNASHQQALMESWFDIDNWFEMLRIYNIATIQNIINGISPHEQQQEQEQEPEQDDDEAWMQPPPEFQQAQLREWQPAPAWDVRMLLPANIVNPVSPRRNIV